MSHDISKWKDSTALTDDERLIVKLRLFTSVNSLAANNTWRRPLYYRKKYLRFLTNHRWIQTKPLAMSWLV